MSRPAEEYCLLRRLTPADAEAFSALRLFGLQQGGLVCAGAAFDQAFMRFELS